MHSTNSAPNTSKHSDATSNLSSWKKGPFKKKQKLLLMLSAFILFAGVFIPCTPYLKIAQRLTVEREINGQQTKAEVAKDSKQWTKIEQIPKKVRWAFVAAEDSLFYEHSGFDFEQIKRSYELNKKKKRFVRGASTISQQLVKISFLSHERSLIRKGREALGTVLLELTLNKDEILEWYLNLVELGDNLYGIGEASQHYFGKSPQNLSLNQGIYLAMVLPSPKKWSNSLNRRQLSEFAQRRFAFIAKQLRQLGVISADEYLAALTTGNFGLPVVHAQNEIARLRSLECQNFPDRCVVETSEEEFENFGADEPLDAPLSVAPKSSNDLLAPVPEQSVEAEKSSELEEKSGTLQEPKLNSETKQEEFIE
ncbi:MAG: monofunctional biosynthetic peptidoglycan transglycosylase [Oligoflexales bacterium]|nr:monofunctional biosynthetic peptidoglycan transglycosylase [Oligoflexales bacterium]